MGRKTETVKKREREAGREGERLRGYEGRRDGGRGVKLISITYYLSLLSF